MKTRFYINGVEINDPNNYPELELEINYAKDDNDNVTTNNWDLGVGNNTSSDAVKLCLKQINNGLSGGIGVFEGIPFQIYIDDEKTKKYKIFDGYLDLSKSKIYCDRIIAKSTEQGSLDWLNTVADSVTYEYLYDNNHFGNSYFVPVPYCINKKQNNLEIIITLVTIYILNRELKKQIVSIQQLVASSANPFQAPGSIISLSLQILDCVVLFAAINKMIADLYYMVVQPVKYHNSMYIKDLVEIGLSYFGLTLSSSILQQQPFNRMLLLPEKYNIKEDNTGKFENVLGVLKDNKNEKNGFYKGTVGELLRTLKLMFNAKVEVRNGVLYFEKQDFNLTSAKYKLPNLVDSGYEFNSDEFISNYIISFSIDFDDRNTVQEYEGTSFQLIQVPNSVVNKRMVLTKNLKQVNIPFSLAKRKTKLTKVEKILNVFYTVIGALITSLITLVNAVIFAINIIIEAINRLIRALSKVGIRLPLSISPIRKLTDPNLQRLIENRKGMLMMESDYVSTPKVMLITDHTKKRANLLDSDNETILNAKYIFNNYHYFCNFVTTNGWNNQAIIRDFENIPFTFTDYEKVRLNSFILNSDGDLCELISLKWNPIKQTATGKYKQRKIYTNNLTSKEIYPNE